MPLAAIRHFLDYSHTDPANITQDQQYQIYMTDPRKTFVYALQETKLGRQFNVALIIIGVLYASLHMGLSSSERAKSTLSIITVCSLGIIVICCVFGIFLKNDLISKWF